jgi:hypothetical protein
VTASKSGDGREIDQGGMSRSLTGKSADDGPVKWRWERLFLPARNKLARALKSCVALYRGKLSTVGSCSRVRLLGISSSAGRDVAASGDNGSLGMVANIVMSDCGSAVIIWKRPVATCWFMSRNRSFCHICSSLASLLPAATLGSAWEVDTSPCSSSTWTPETSVHGRAPAGSICPERLVRCAAASALLRPTATPRHLCN